MISAFALGGAVLHEPRYAEAARRAAEFIISRLYDPQTGVLLRRYRAGRSRHPRLPGRLRALHQGPARSLRSAVRSAPSGTGAPPHREACASSSKTANPAASSAPPPDDPTLVLRVKEDYDGAEPSGNSVAVLNLLRLAAITGRDDFRESADRTLRAFGSRLSHVPVAIPQMLVACEWLLGRPARDRHRGTGRRRRSSRPCTPASCRNKIVLLVDSPETRERLAVWAPWIAADAARRRPCRGLRLPQLHLSVTCFRTG